LIVRRMMETHRSYVSLQEVSPVSPYIRGDRDVRVPGPALSLLGLLGLGLLLLGGLPT
jgi:hypothetical protein